MAEYKGIRGFKVQSLASDPTLVEGQVWYNTTTNLLKYQGLAAGAWSSSNTINQTRSRAGGLGIQTAGLITGGSTGAPWVFYQDTETYDGTSWTQVNDLNTARALMNGCGTQTTGLVAGGFSYDLSPNYSALTEKYDGTSWSEAADLTTPRSKNGGNGTQTAAFNAGGEGVPGGATGVSEEWDGTSWSEGNDLNTTRGNTRGSGTQTNGLTISGDGGAIGKCEAYDGTCWSAVADLGTARYAGGCPSQAASASLFFAGRPPTSGTALTEAYDGTSWSEVADQATATTRPAFFGTNTLAVRAGGSTSPSATTNTSEEWTRALAVKTVTVS